MFPGRFILALFILMNFLQVFSEPVVIRGSAPDAIGMTAELLTYSDFISNNELKLAESRIGQDGIFEFKPEIKYTTFAYLKIGLQKSEILLEPGKTYNLKISGLLDRSLRDKDIPPFQIPALFIEISNPWRFELNGLVRDFLIFHDNFLLENSMALVRQRDGRLVQQYIQELYNRFPGINNAWFNEMLTYKIASVEMMARAKGRETIASQYILNKDILYHHMVYMDFFNQLFEKYLFTSRMYDRLKLIEAMESANPYKSMMDILSKDPLLPDKQLRELVLIKSMLDFSGAPGFYQSDAIRLLAEIKTGSNFSEHRIIAENLILRLQP